jgi:hypothetical protein
MGSRQSYNRIQAVQRDPGRHSPIRDGPAGIIHHVMTIECVSFNHKLALLYLELQHMLHGAIHHHGYCHAHAEMTTCLGCCNTAHPIHTDLEQGKV